MDLTSLAALADQAYRNQSWSSAQLLYQQIAAADPELSIRLSLPLVLAHCALELAAPEQDASSPAPARVIDRESLLGRLDQMRRRAAELCAGRDFDRASRLLRLMAEYDWSIRYSYNIGITDARSDCYDLLRHPPPDQDPPFVAAYPIADAEVARVAARYRGTRVLEVMPTTTPLSSIWVDTAERFGLVARQFDSWTPKPGVPPERYAPSLDEELRAFRPAVVLFWNLFETGLTSHDAIAEEVIDVLAAARRDLGCRVVKVLSDPWYKTEGIYRAVGHSIDLIMHCHPTILGQASAAELAATFCFPTPHFLPEPTVAYDAVPRACFSGAAELTSPARLIWWAELGKRALPIDFKFRMPSKAPNGDQGFVSDIEFANQLRTYRVTINSTRRANGATILTGRTLETALCGGFLLEEESIDSAYFFKRGLHYMPFQTLGDLEALLPALFGDPERRARMSAAAQHWARKYFTGAYFWAGLLSRSAAVAAGDP